MITKLQSGVELPTSSAFFKAENVLCIAVTGITDYAAARALFMPAATASIIVYTDENKASYNIYEGYTKFINPVSITELEDGSMDVVFTFKKPDEVTGKINELSERQSLSENALNELILEI